MTADVPVILFACIHNGGRSLAAKVLAGPLAVSPATASTRPWSRC
jgi:protein-tyrosine-phosphatase